MLINPPEDMKTSEYIRQQIDSFLWHPDRCHRSELRLRELVQEQFLCCLLTRSPDACDEIQWELDRKALRIGKPSSLLVSAQDLPPPILSDCSGSWDARIQELRFMYADFLACYFESIGD